MAIAEQFAGLDMKNLIGAPLSAAADASLQLANSTAEFINKVGFDDTGKLRTVSFGYQKRTANEDGTSNLDEMKVDVPMLAIVPIPNLQVDEVNVLFDMEVKQSENSRESTDISGSASGSAKILFFKANFSCSVSSHKENTRSSDNSAKYHVDVRATNHGIPEGLARVLDMMAANVAPALVGSTLKDGDGKDLTEDAKARATKNKALGNEVAQIESKLSAANKTLGDCITQFVKIADKQQNDYHVIVTRLINKDESKADSYGEAIGEVDQSWNNLKNQAGSLIKMIADNSAEEQKTVSDLLGLMAFKDEKAQAYVSGESQYQALVAAQNSAVKAQINVTKIEDELSSKKQEYNNAIAGIATTTQKKSGSTTKE